MLLAPSPRGSDAADGARSETRPYLPIPINLVVAYKHRPAVIGLYASIARLNVIRKDAVDLSRADLARWCDTERDAIAGCVKRGIDDLDTDGWVLTERPTGGKMRLLVGWSHGAAERPRPWRFDSPNRARPKSMRCIALFLDVLDLGLGRLRPNSDGPAEIDRYFDQALLSYQDIGIYVLSQLADTPLTPRLDAICLPTSAPNTPITFPTLATLLERVAAGALTITDTDTTVCVRLSPVGSAYYQRLAQRQPGVLVAQGGSVHDHAPDQRGSAPGSTEIRQRSAAPSPITPTPARKNASWDQDGIHELKKYDSSSHNSHATRMETTKNHDDAGTYKAPTARAESADPCNVPVVTEIHTIADSEENHISALDTRVMQWHQALNPDRTIPHAERFALLHVQEQYGIDALKRWQFNASSAGKTYILPSYYQQCAATQAYDVLNQTSPRPQLPTAHQTAAVHQEPGARAQVRAGPLAPVPPRLDAEHAALIADIARITRCAIRRPEKLADIALDLLTRWRDSVHHPGLLARWRMGWVINEISLGHEPPTLDELAQWAEEHGISAYDPRLAPFRQMQAADAPSAVDALRHNDQAAHAEAAARPDEPAHRGRAQPIAVFTHTALWQEVCRALVERADRSAHAVLRSLFVCAMDETVVTLGIPYAAHKQIIEDTYLPLIRDLLSEYLGRAVRVRMVIAPPPATAEALHGSQPAPPAPAWITMSTWNHLHADLRAILADSRLLNDGSLEVSDAAYQAICAQWEVDVQRLVRACGTLAQNGSSFVTGGG